MRSFLQRIRDDYPGTDKDTFESELYDDLKKDVGMILTSRAISSEDDNVGYNILNYGVKVFVANGSTEEKKDLINTQVKESILTSLSHFEPRCSNTVLDEKFSGELYSVFTVKTVFQGEYIIFNVKWNKLTGDLSLDG